MTAFGENCLIIHCFIRFADVHGTDYFIHCSTIHRRQTDTGLAHLFAIHQRHIGDRFIFDHVATCIVFTEQIQISVCHTRRIVSTTLCYLAFFYRLFNITDVISDRRCFSLIPGICVRLLFVTFICTFFLTYSHQFLLICIYIKLLYCVFFSKRNLAVFFYIRSAVSYVYNIDGPVIIFPHI